MEDTSENTIEAVTTPSEVWHLAINQAFERAATLVRSAGDSGGSPDLASFCTRLIEDFNDESESAFREYRRRVDTPRLLGTDRQDMTIGFDRARDLPVVQWNSPDKSNSWGMIDIDAVGSEAGLIMAMPFRVVDVSRFPESTLLIKLQDPRHAATAALVEALHCARRDAEGVFSTREPSVAWRRFNQVINTYRSGAHVAMEKLKDDDFVGWRPSVAPAIEIGAAASLICSIAATSKAQRTVAVQLVVAWLQALADWCESIDDENGIDVLMDRLSAAISGIEKVLDGLNHALAQSRWSGGEFKSFVIMRPYPDSIPMLAVVPKAANDNLKKLPQRKKAKRRAPAG